MRRWWGLAGLVAALATPAWAQVRPPVDLRPDFSQMSRAEVRAVIRAMPKGGDLHIHLSGSPYAETYLQWAAEDGLCVDTVRWTLTDPCTPGADLVSASDLTPDQRSLMIDSLSTRQAEFAGRSGHDQFFSSFDRFGATPDHRRGDMLADLMTTLAAQNTFYVEVMWMPQSRQARDLGAAAGDGSDLAAMDAALAVGLPALVQAAMAETDAVEARAREVLGCGSPRSAGSVHSWDPPMGCRVTVRFLIQANRLIPPAQTYGQIALGEALIAADPRWVGLQLVAPEDHPNALANYDGHMTMFARLAGRGVPVALHAGELTLDYATPRDIRDHVWQAVGAGARRIGHGVTIPHETGARQLVAHLAADGIAVEINLTSNADILGVEGEDHPVIWLREAGVPVIYTTDDPGISRSDLSNEYARAVFDTGATYEDLVTSARNALAFSFLPGEGLWQDPGRYDRMAPACAGQVDRAHDSACQGLLDASLKARVQWAFETRLATFERDLAAQP
jgi:adenosine deaminase